ncbi:hypothetical protein BS50DRAFT_570502 [Corynespora cassiicola Philippines]|uniref:Cora-domain-containing protein n=1 Tax=Corynespora cassiicola Philippines TaxID=1448308 RepID=A0A2T2P084_CORCC|nr:hypothetical protein BS50DRAFT_570502 [Corynespora cassiicola Philippines]
MAGLSRRNVERSANRTVVTRKSAQARISELPQSSLQSLKGGAQDNSTGLSSSRLFSASNATARPRGRRPAQREPEESEESDDGDDDDYSSFILDLRKKEVLRLDGESGTDGALGRITPQRSESPSPSADSTTPFGLQTTTYRVLKSSYEGDLFRNVRLKAQIFIGPHKRPGQHEFFRPLFRWIHVENPDMHFGPFMDYVTRCEYLDASERESLGSILRTAREKSDRSLRRPTTGMTGSYIEPEYLSETVENTVCIGPRSKQTKKVVAQWIAIPYFYLTSKDMDKPAPENKKGCVSEGDYFQVAQFWCLILDDTFMISCARVPVNDIPGNMIKLNHVPPPDPERPLIGYRTPMLQVSDGGLRLWLLPIEECETWAAFAANFVGLGFNVVDGWRVKLKFANIVLNASDWPTVLSIAKKTSVRLEIFKKEPDKDKDDENSDVTLDDDSEIELDEIATPEGEQPKVPSSPTKVDLSKSAVSDTTQVLLVDEFHVFTLFATEPVSSGIIDDEKTGMSEKSEPVQYQVNEKQLLFDLAQLDQYLLNENVRHRENLSYAQCPQVSSYDMELSLSNQSGQEDYLYKKTFARTARDVFELFFPLRYEHSITLRFWGSICRIIQTKNITTDPEFKKLAKKLSLLARICKEIRQEVFAERDLPEFMTTVPDEFIQAWILIQMSLICFPSAPSSRRMNHLRRCKELMLQARLLIIERLQPIDIRQREAVTPTGVTILILGQLLHDSQGPLTPERHRLTSAYWDFFKNLKHDVHANPLNRKFEGTFTTLKAEFETIIGTLEDQRRVLIALEDSINEAEAQSFVGGSKVGATVEVEPTREQSVTEYLLHQTEEMLQNFWEMSKRLTELDNWHMLALSADSDMQNKATFAFTTVTVFFLPLTTLTGILGMNSSDLRDMEAGQWLFWAVGTPLAVICLFIWFVYLGSFEKMWRTTRKKGLMNQ